MLSKEPLLQEQSDKFILSLSYSLIQISPYDDQNEND